MKQLAILPVLIAVLGVAAGARAQSGLDGIWKGKTSQGRDIAVTVKSGAITSLKMAVRLKLDSPCAKPGSPVALDYRGGEAESTYVKPIPITAGSFNLTSGVFDVDAKVSGKFSGDTLSGEVRLQAAAASGCSGKDRLTWNAARPAPAK